VCVCECEGGERERERETLNRTAKSTTELLPDQQKTIFVVTVSYKYVEKVKRIQTHELNMHNCLQLVSSPDQI
jgi:transposase